jgi:acyl-CoA thioesterase FadM
MARIKINHPTNIHFETLLKLRIYDMNYGGHLGNDSVLSIIHEARVRFLLSLNLSEKNFYGNGLLMVDSAVLYKKQGFYGDTLNIKLSINEFSKYGFEITYIILDNLNNAEYARAKTGLVCYNYDLKKMRLIPESFKLLFMNLKK